MIVCQCVCVSHDYVCVCVTCVSVCVIMYVCHILVCVNVCVFEREMGETVRRLGGKDV